MNIATIDLKNMIALGRYDYSDGDIITDESAPLPEGFVFGLEPKLFHFDRSLDPETEMAKLDYRLATLWDLLDYGVKNPDEQRQYPIVALGTKITLSEEVSVTAYLSGDSFRRSFAVDWGCGHDMEVTDEDDVLYQDYLNRRRFLGVKK